MYLLSTLCFADLISRDPQRPIVSWLGRVQPGPRELFVSVVSFGIVASSIEDLPREARGQWRRLLQEGRRVFIDRGTAVDVDVTIVDAWASDLRTFDLSESAEGQRANPVGEDERLVTATAIARGLTLVAPPTQHLTELCDRTSLTVVNP